jgi:hypothetical protein
MNTAADKVARLSPSDILLGYITANLSEFGNTGVYRIALQAVLNSEIIERVDHTYFRGVSTFSTVQDFYASADSQGPRYNFLNGYRLNRGSSFRTSGAGWEQFDGAEAINQASPGEIQKSAPTPLVLGPSETYKIQMKFDAPFSSGTARFSFLANAVEEAA